MTAACQTYPAEALRADGIATTALLIQGQTAPCILKDAERLRVDLIIMGTHGHGAMFELIVGSVAHAVVRDSRIPILLGPPPEALNRRDAVSRDCKIMC